MLASLPHQCSLLADLALQDPMRNILYNFFICWWVFKHHCPMFSNMLSRNTSVIFVQLPISFCVAVYVPVISIISCCCSLFFDVLWTLTCYLISAFKYDFYPNCITVSLYQLICTKHAGDEEADKAWPTWLKSNRWFCNQQATSSRLWSNIQCGYIAAKSREKKRIDLCCCCNDL